MTEPQDSTDELIDRGDVEQRHVDKLAPKQRMDYEACVVGDLSYKEQARRRKVGYNTIVMNVREAKKNLKESIQADHRRKAETGYWCSICQAPMPEEDTAIAALRHHLTEHPQQTDDLFHERVTIVRECEECGTKHDAVVNIRGGRIWADALCPECEEENPLATLIASELTPEQLVEGPTTVAARRDAHE